MLSESFYHLEPIHQIMYSDIFQLQVSSLGHLAL